MENTFNKSTKFKKIMKYNQEKKTTKTKISKTKSNNLTTKTKPQKNYLTLNNNKKIALLKEPRPKTNKSKIVMNNY